jgi:hypothetical protein
VARPLAQKLYVAFGYPVIIDNRPARAATSVSVWSRSLRRMAIRFSSCPATSRSIRAFTRTRDTTPIKILCQ